MSCSPPIRTITIAKRRPIFSKGGATPENEFFTLSPEELEDIAPMLEGVRATIEVENATLNFRSKAAFQSTNGSLNGESWLTAVDLETEADGNRVSTTAWYTTTSNFLRGIRFGVIATNSSGQGVEVAWVTMTIDLLLRS